MEKKSFVLYGDYKEHFALLSAEDQGQLLMAIFEYVEEGTQPALSPAAMMAFSFIRLQLDRDEARYAETCQRRQAAGKKSGEVRRNKREQKQETGTLVPFVQQTGTNETDNENETDTENDTENENVTESVPPISPQGGTEAPSPLLRRLLPHYTLQIELQDRINKWVHYKQERGEGYKSQGLTAVKSALCAGEIASGGEIWLRHVKSAFQTGLGKTARRLGFWHGEKGLADAFAFDHINNLLPHGSPSGSGRIPAGFPSNRLCT